MKNIIEVSNISRHYKVGTQVVKAIDTISVDIKKNEYVSVMGASGSGKSTFDEYYWMSRLTYWWEV